MNDDIKEFLILWLLVIGHMFLWGSIGIGFLDWTYDMGFFRTTILGLIMVGISMYLTQRIEERR